MTHINYTKSSWKSFFAGVTLFVGKFYKKHGAPKYVDYVFNNDVSSTMEVPCEVP